METNYNIIFSSNILRTELEKQQQIKMKSCKLLIYVSEDNIMFPVWTYVGENIYGEEATGAFFAIAYQKALIVNKKTAPPKEVEDEDCFMVDEQFYKCRKDEDEISFITIDILHNCFEAFTVATFFGFKNRHCYIQLGKLTAEKCYVPAFFVESDDGAKRISIPVSIPHFFKNVDSIDFSTPIKWLQQGDTFIIERKIIKVDVEADGWIELIIEKQKNRALLS